MKVNKSVLGSIATSPLKTAFVALLAAALSVTSLGWDVSTATATNASTARSARSDRQKATRTDREKAARQERYSRQMAARQERYRRQVAKANKGWKTATCSWYGPGLIGSPLAGGGTLKRDAMIVAHKKLPFGTKVQFSYKGRTCTAVVRDRGPFIKGREFDLGPGTAHKLGFDGVAKVRYRIVR